MKISKSTALRRRVIACALSLIVGVTFIPILGGGVCAEATAPQSEEAVIDAEGDLPDVDIEIPSEGDIKNVTDEDAPEADLQDITAPEDALPADPEGLPSADLSAELESSPSAPAPQGRDRLGAPASVCTITQAELIGTNYILKCSINKNSQTHYKFGQVVVDGTLLYNANSATSINRTFDFSGLKTGFHTVAVQVLKDGATDSEQSLVHRYIPINKLTAAPTYKGSFEVYSKSLDIYPYNMTGSNQAGNLYLEYSCDGGKTWNRSGYMKANSIELYIQQGYTISGLKANKNYKTRLRYGTVVTYSTSYMGDGKAYFFGGPVLNTGTYKTGKAAKPKVKSVKVKAIKKKYHKIKHYGPITGVYLYTEKFWTCKIKVTVKLKKKPGTKGIWVNGKYLKGNKKKYTTTFTPYPNYFVKKPPRKMGKYTVTIKSYQSKSYGGFSPAYKKKKKVK